MRHLLVSFLFLTPLVAQAQTFGVCTFADIPIVIFEYSETAPRVGTMRVGGRPAVEMTLGQGAGRMESAIVDGYSFRFSPANSWMDVETSEGDTVFSQAGKCAFTNQPDVTEPLTLSSTDPVDLTEETTPELADTGEWNVTLDRSAFDDTATVVLSLQSTTLTRGRFGQAGYPTLFLRCKENTTVMYVHAAGAFLSDIQGYGMIDYRIDDRQPGTWNADASTDNEALGLWNGRQSIPAIRRFIGAEKIIMRLTPYNESPIEFSFSLNGLESAILPLQAACNWN